MLQIVFAALFQAVSGAPEETPPAAPAALEEPAPAQQAATAEDERSARNRRRCRIESVTGTRLGARVCLSPNEEDMLAQEAQSLLRDHMRIADDGDRSLSNGK